MDFSTLDLNALSTYGGAQNAPTASTAKDTVPTSSPSLVNSLTGFLSKAADTALDLYSTQQTAKAVGSLYPTGQQNPASVASAAGNQKAFNWMPWAIGGGIAVVLIIGLVAVSGKK